MNFQNFFKIKEVQQSKYFEGISRITANSENKVVIFDTLLNIPNDFKLTLQVGPQIDPEYSDDQIIVYSGIIYKIEKNKSYISYGGLLMEIDYELPQDNLDSECVCIISKVKN